MSLLFTVTDNATPELREFIDSLENRRPLMAALGARLEDELTDHFLQRNAQPNKRGFAKKNFWADIRDNTALDSVTDDDASVGIADPRIFQKIYGGKITPKRGKALAIPLTAAADAAGSPGEQDVWGKDELFFLDRSAEGKAPLLAIDDDGNLRPQYVLVRSVTQEPDRDALPSEQKIQDGLDEEFSDYMERFLP